jgi:hypothetical protein
MRHQYHTIWVLGHASGVKQFIGQWETPNWPGSSWSPNPKVQPVDQTSLRLELKPDVWGFRGHEIRWYFPVVEIGTFGLVV